MWRVIRPRSINSLCLHLHKAQKDGIFIYRGQADKSWALTPTILRDFNDYHEGISEAAMLQRECNAIEMFQRKASLHLGVHEREMLSKISDCIMVMQHYGAATRLLDWSKSPWIAAYFAAINLPKVDGAIWGFDAAALDDLSPLENLSAPNIMTPNNRPFLLSEAWTVPLWYKISANSSADMVYIIAANVENWRMSAQQSVFTMAGRIAVDHTIIGKQLSGLGAAFKIIIPSNLKSELIHRLLKMNITAVSLFPDILGIAQRAREGLRFDRPSTSPEAYADRIERSLHHIRLSARGALG